MSSRIIAIGDVHGCSVALKTLINAIGPRPEDTMIFLGDVIDYGPDSKGVVEQLIDLSRRCRFQLIRGNHEEMLFHAHDGHDDMEFWKMCGGEATLGNYPGQDRGEPIDPDHFRFLKERARDYLELDEFIFVHANYYPNMAMADPTGDTLRWEAVVPSRMAPHYSGKTVIAGHTPQTSGEVLDLGFLMLVDTDCSRGGWLTALDVGTGELMQANQRGGTRRFSKGRP